MIVNFKQIKKDDVSVAGGKAANLGELVSLGINVPHGFVVTTDAYKNFIKENGIDKVITQALSETQNDDAKRLNDANHISQLINNGQFSKHVLALIEQAYNKLGNNISVAVRSSATTEDLADASFAGQQETYLNVQGIDDVLNQIKSCFASLWNKRAVVYRAHHAYNQNDLAIAVVVQTMVESEKSGVLFTINPLNNNQNEIVINANYGLGESVVSGSATADNYVVAKSGEISTINIANKETQVVYAASQTKAVSVESEKRQQRVLNDEELRRLLHIALKIERHYGYPVDIEWAINSETIHILQARAITTLDQKPSESRAIPAYIKNVKIKKYNRELLSFLIEKIPFTFRAIEFDYFTIVSEQKITILEENGLSLSKNLVMDTDGLMSIQRESVSLNRNIYKIFKFLKLMRDYDACAKQCRQFLNNHRTKANQYKTLNFEQMTLNECKTFIIDSYRLTEIISYNRFKYAVIPSLLNRSLTKAIKKVDPHYTSFDLYWGLANRTSQVAQEIAEMADYVKQSKALSQAILDGLNYKELCQQFADFENLTNDFLNNHGYIVDNISYCVSGKSFIEDPDRIIKLLKPLIIKNDNAIDKIEDKDFADLSAALKTIYGQKYPKLEKKIKHFRYFHYVREEGQYLYEMINFYLRQCLKRINILLLGDENYQQGVANLFYSELIEVLNKGQLNDIDSNKIKARNDNMPFAQKVWNASKLVIYDKKADKLIGLSGSAGVVVAKVCVINNPSEFYKMQKGDVLVCPFTAPEWTPLFKLASAVVADTGSALSHAAIVAREFGIPAVLGVGYATTMFKDGDMIKVDGNKGEVTGL